MHTHDFVSVKYFMAMPRQDDRYMIILLLVTAHSLMASVSVVTWKRKRMRRIAH